ncbi:hypothetical protein FOA52_001215 [Chlamydomonas sp. UWO 241]|nr:hypothetical protein FOA52_001215 [Chlamydomonas sp. UWO 241]
MHTPLYTLYSAIYFVITTATTTGNGDVVPKTIAELVICNIIMIGGMLMIGIVVGTVSQFMTRASGNAAEIHSMSKKISSVDEWLDKHGVGKETKRRVKNFFSQDHPPPGDGVEVFKDVPHSYRHTLASHLMVGTVSSLKLFKCQELGLRQLVAQYLRPVDIAPGCDLCHQGTEGDCLWVLTEGSLQALQYMCAPLTVTAPSLVGDSLLLRDDVPAFGARCFTIRSFKAATQRVVAWELPLVNLAPILRMYPSLRTDTLEHVRNRTLVQLASGGDNRNSWRPTAGTIGGSTLTDWCESVTSITRTLLNQSQDLVDTTMEELRKARTQDASLQHLLDTLLDFSISNVHQKGNSTLDRVSSIGSATRGEYDFGTGAVRRVLSNQRRLSISRESLHQLSIPRGSQPSAPDPGAHAGGGGGGGGGRAGRGGGGGVEEDVGERVGGGGRGDHGLATNSTGGSHTAHRAPRPHGRGSALGSASVGLAGGGPEGPQSSSLGGGGRRALLAPPYLKKLSTVKEQEAKGAKQVQGAPSKGSEAQQQADAGASNREGGMAAQGGGGDSERAGIVAGLQPEARGDGMVASPFLSDAVAAGRAAASGAGAAAGRAAASGAGTASGASTVTSTDRLPAALTGAAPPLLLRIAPPLLLHPADPASPPASSERLPRVSVLNALNAASDSLTRVPHPSSPRASFGSHRSVSLSSPRRHSIGSPGGLSPLASRGRAQAQQIASLVDVVSLLVSRVPGAPMQMPHAEPARARAGHAAHSAAPRAAPAAEAAQPARPAAAAAPVASAGGGPATERPASCATRAASARGPSRRGGLPARVGDTSLHRSFVLSIPVARGANWFLAGGGRRMDEEEATAAAAERIAAAAEDGTSLPVRLATDVVRFLYGGTGRREPADGGVVSASLLNAKPAVGGIGVEPRGGGVLRVLFTVASDAVADTVVRWRHELRRCVDSTAVFDVLSDREEAQHQALWPAFLAAKVAGKRAQFHRARLVVDGERAMARHGGCDAIFMHHTFTAPRHDFNTLLVKKQLKDVNKDTPVVCWGNVRLGGTPGRSYHYAINWPSSDGNAELSACLLRLKRGGISAAYVKSTESIGLRVFSRDDEDLPPEAHGFSAGLFLLPMMMLGSNNGCSSAGGAPSSEAYSRSVSGSGRVGGVLGGVPGLPFRSTSGSVRQKVKIPRVPFFASEGARMRAFLQAVQEQRESEDREYRESRGGSTRAAVGQSAGRPHVQQAQQQQQQQQVPRQSIDSRQASFDMRCLISAATRAAGDPSASAAIALAAAAGSMREASHHQAGSAPPLYYQQQQQQPGGRTGLSGATSSHVPSACDAGDAAACALAFSVAGHLSAEQMAHALVPRRGLSRASAAASVSATPARLRSLSQAAATQATLSRAAAALLLQLRGGDASAAALYTAPEVAAPPGAMLVQIRALVEEVARLQGLVIAKRAREEELGRHLQDTMPEGEVEDSGLV